MDENTRKAWKNKPTETDDTIDDVAVQLQKERRERKPLFYCRWIATRPFLLFFLTLILQLVPVVITVIMIVANYDLFPTNFKDLPMELFDIPYTIRDFSFRDKDLYENRVYRNLTDSGYPTYERGISYSFINLELYFDTEGGNILSKSHLEKIKYIEEYLIAADKYTSYCQTIDGTTCKEPTSLIRYFDGTYASINPIFNDTTFSNIPGVIYEAFTNNDTKDDFKYFLPHSYSITTTSTRFSITRTQISIGCSLTGSTNCKLMEELSQTWLGESMKPRLDNLRDDITQFDFYYMSFYLFLYDLKLQAMQDMLFVVGSMVFIFCFMAFHTRSLFVSGLAVMSILISFVGTNIIYRCIIDFQYFGFFHILAMFIILGIGADDIFVFFDAWRLTAFSPYPSLAHRLNDAYSKSCKSMFITSLTTAVAFTASALSPLLATKSFGVFAAILVVYNYFSVIIFFPTVVMVYHFKFESWKWPCFSICKKKKDSFEIDHQVEKGRNSSTKMVPQNDTSEHTDNKKEAPYSIKADVVMPLTRMSDATSTSLSEKLQIGYIATNNSSQDEEKIRDASKNMSIKDKLAAPYVPKKKKKENIIVVFFRDRYFRFITMKWTRIVLIPVFIAIVCMFGYYASTLAPDSEQVQYFKDNHHYSKATRARDYKMVVNADDSLVTIHAIWGLGNKDRSDCHFSSIECRGNNVYDETFDPNPVANQQALIDFCNRLYNFTTSEVAKYRIKTDYTGQIQVACFTGNLNTFLQSKSTDIGIGDLSLPWNYTKTINFMNALSADYNTSSFNTSFTDYLTIPVGYWLYNAFNKNYTADFGYFDELIGEYKDTSGFTKQLLSDSSIYYGTKFKYIGIEISTTINYKTTSYVEGIPLVEMWENFFSSEVSKMPTGLKNGFQLTFLTWHWFYVQKSLVDNAIQGIIIGVTLAFSIITLTTMNVIIGFFATLSICCTTVCVIGVIPLVGWKLGVLESLNMCLLVGVAVDYVVHLAEGYHLSLHKDRLNRTRDMLEQMGTSVFSGACTTLGASAFMFFAVIQFFMQFGVFLFCTIGFSLLFSLGMFTLLMGLCGPENNTGCLKTLFSKLTDKCRKKEYKVEYSEGDIHPSLSTPSIVTVAHRKKKEKKVKYSEGNINLSLSTPSINTVD